MIVHRDVRRATVSGKLVLCWLAVLGSAVSHELSNGKEFEVCSGLLPKVDTERFSMAQWPDDYADLFGQHFEQCEHPFLFFTPAPICAVNCVARFSKTGILELTGYNTDSRATGYCELFWVAIARRNSEADSAVDRNLWINCGPSSLVRNHAPTAVPGDWSSYHRPFQPFFSQPPHTLMTGSGLNVEGHHCSVVCMAYHQEQKSGNMKARSCDLTPGQSGVSWIAFGPVDDNDSGS